ncbi:MAG: peptidase, partial [Akkermansiaceae bacterium]|nr:peptidase [Akkermansiaceae bacterium]
LYAFPGDWTLSGIGTHENNALSQTDKAFIGSMYPKSGDPVPEVVALTVGEVIVRAASIGDPGEEDLFSFRVPSTGKYVVETKGDTDVVMKLFGPDSRSILVDEDDDSGEARNARIEAELPPGEFTVQLRHFSESAGTGDYGVSVTRFND